MKTTICALVVGATLLIDSSFVLAEVSATSIDQGSIQYPPNYDPRVEEFTRGVLLYRRGDDDRSALATLRQEIADDAPSLYARLALTDLYVIHGKFASARRVLEELEGNTSAGELGGPAGVWMAWIDFWANRPSLAARNLEALTSAAPTTRVEFEAGFTMGWQLLLQGRYVDAGLQFHRLASSSGDDPLALRTREQARLLEGQSLMWDGQLEPARELLARFVETSPGSPLADDAERDLAWCDYRQGDIDGATRRLRAATKSATHKADRAGDLSVAWPAVAVHGPPVFMRELRRAYGRRPRGMMPMSFLLSVGDRFAAPDARRLLRWIGSPAVLGAEGSITRAKPTKPVPDETWAADKTWAAPIDKARNRSASHGLWLTLACVLLLAASIVIRRLRRDIGGRR